LPFSGLPYDKDGIFVVAQTEELCMSQVIGARPFQELDLGNDPWLQRKRGLSTVLIFLRAEYNKPGQDAELS
jgi:hypothetical protein